MTQNCDSAILFGATSDTSNLTSGKSEVYTSLVA